MSEDSRKTGTQKAISTCTDDDEAADDAGDDADDEYEDT